MYTLAHLGVLWKDTPLIDEAKAVAADIQSLVETDRMLDVIRRFGRVYRRARCSKHGQS